MGHAEQSIRSEVSFLFLDEFLIDGLEFLRMGRKIES